MVSNELLNFFGAMLGGGIIGSIISALATKYYGERWVERFRIRRVHSEKINDEVLKIWLDKVEDYINIGSTYSKKTYTIFHNKDGLDGEKMQRDISDQSDLRVVDFERWRDLQNFEGLQPRAGVYIFADVNWQVKYIGKAGAGRIVSEIYSAINRGKDYGATRVKALYTNSSENAERLERALITKYNPPNNLT